MDIVLSLIGLVVLSPVLFLAALAIRLKIGSPIIFKQQRPGLHGKPFYMIKFRTMTDRRDKNGELLPDEQRLTRFGNFLRKSSIDELPELVNVLKGDMSLVGPRPLLMHYLPLYNDEQKRRHEIRPGVTGWAQVSGRNAISWERKFELDVWYIDHISFLLDVKILFLTIWKVVKKDGISAQDCATMPHFQGTK